MATEVAKFLRANTSDSFTYRLPQDSADMRHQLGLTRKLPAYGVTNPTTRGTVKVTRDVAVLDAQGAVLRTQPITVDIAVSIPAGAERTSFDYVASEALSVARQQLAALYDGVIPASDITITIP